MTSRNVIYFLTGLGSRRPRKERSVLLEHSLVKLSSGLGLEDGRTLPVGSTGAVVGIWAGGAAYEVEFSEPFHAVATVSASKLKPLRAGTTA